jgi:hypothetical protein
VGLTSVKQTKYIGVLFTVLNFLSEPYRASGGRPGNQSLPVVTAASGAYTRSEQKPVRIVAGDIARPVMMILPSAVGRS